MMIVITILAAAVAVLVGLNQVRDRATVVVPHRRTGWGRLRGE